VDIPASAQNEPIAMRRAKPHKSNIVKFLEEIGYEDIFDTNEAKEIKEMLNITSVGLTKNEMVLDSIHKFETSGDLESKQDEDKDNDRDIDNHDNKEKDHDDQYQNNHANDCALEADKYKDHPVAVESAKDNEETKVVEEPRPVSTRLNLISSTSSVYNLISHLDVVRDGIFFENMDVAITVSEDCLIKLWDLKLLDQDEKQLTEDTKYNFIEDRSEYAGNSKSIYSSYTYRGHTGIITKVVADQLKDTEDGAIFYTAGIEGIIRVWKVVKPGQVNQFGPECDITRNH
jgi:WD40 repeat protein